MVKELIYMIFCGTSAYPIINSLWASIDKKGIIPTEIVLLASGSQNSLELITKKVKIFIDSILDNCTIDLLMISEWDIEKNIDLLMKNIDESIQHGKKLVIDITPSRKTMSISGVLLVNKVISKKSLTLDYFQHLIYWHLIESDKYQSKWYPEIPRENFNFVDLMEVLR